MLATILVLGIVIACCIAAVFRPTIGVLGFYGVYTLQPEWNWRWTMLQTMHFQDWLAICTLVGTLVNFGSWNRMTRTVFAAYLCLAGFLALALVSMTQSINMTASTFYMDHLWKIILMATLAAMHLNSRQAILAMVWILVVTQGYNAYQINLQYFQDGFSLFATSPWGDNGDNNLYTIVTLPVIFMSGALCIYSKASWQKMLAGGIAMLQIHQVMLMESRGGMLGGLAGAAVFALLMPKTPKSAAILTTLALVTAALAGPPVVKEFSSAFVERDQLDSSAASRFKLWKAGWEITQDYPALGVGPYAGQYLVPSYYDGPTRRDRKGLHNLFFEISTGTGLPATFLFLFHFGLIILQLLRMRQGAIPPDCQMVILAVISGQVAYWLASMFSSGALLESTYINSAIGAAAICNYSTMPSREEVRPTEGHVPVPANELAGVA